MMETLETKINNYKMSDGVAELVRTTPLLLVSAPVGGGKNTVITELLKSDAYYEIISHTTRLPRENQGVMEQNGIEYHFIDLSEAERMVDAGEFVEAKYVHGNVYGTSTAELRKAHDNQKIAATDIDIKGVVEYLDIKPDTHAIFLLPPSVDTWLSRLSRRYGDLSQHQEEIETRLRTAKQEIESVRNDSRFILVINDDLETTVERIGQIISGERDHTSDFALSITEHLLEYINNRLAS